MAAPAPKDHTITLAEAAEMTQRYRDNFIKGGFFWKDQILTMLTEESIGMRYYYGIDKDGKKTIILVAVDEFGNDICDGEIMDFSTPCPSACGVPNPLNND
ncbi:MAG: hypothetical protein IPP32_08345 [Bacteroidetes bacterium]|nr:hypothetical protein [Bacteroidota bacterium]